MYCKNALSFGVGPSKEFTKSGDFFISFFFSLSLLVEREGDMDCMTVLHSPSGGGPWEGQAGIQGLVQVVKSNTE